MATPSGKNSRVNKIAAIKFLKNTHNISGARS